MFKKNLSGWGGVLLALLLAACARDVNDPNQAAPYPNSVRMRFQMSDVLSPDIWYYFVFNFTQVGTAPAVSPFDKVSGEDRGRNWQLYVSYHPGSGGTLARWQTLQRPGIPTVIPVASGPSCAAIGDFGGDTQPDIAVACASGGVVQVIRAITSINLLDPTYYDLPVTVYTGSSPRLIFTGDLNSDGSDDLLLVDAGSGGSGELRVLANSGDLQFTPGTPVPVSGEPLDAVFADFNGDSAPDLALALDGPGATEHRVELFLNSGGNFASAGSHALPARVVQLASGQLNDPDDLQRDLAVAVATGGGAEAVRVLLGDGSGGFTDGPTRSLPGEVRGLAVGDVFGTLDDIVASYDAAGRGQVAAFLRSAGEPALATAPVLQALIGRAGYTLVHEAGNDNRRDAIIVDGDGSSGTSLAIVRGERATDPDDQLRQLFVWQDEMVLYPSAVSPVRVLAGALNGDGIDDLVTVNNGQGQNGNAVSLYFGLGKYNYTNSDIYWTDDVPEELAVKPWQTSFTAGPNYVELEIDPGVFYDLALLQPQDEFYVQFMTATSGIDLNSNPDQLGLVADFLRTPVRVPMEVGFTTDEQQQQLAGSNVPPVQAQDIFNWAVEVL